ncbi:C-type lectin domain family 2 member B-like isoform X2 [Paroedura picta]|uniref:C-type lectin domain family 2 member B-like isoform X2 n=1 Tax=Paroedura picta TaxID=143630 RepID=UPI004056EF54
MEDSPRLRTAEETELSAEDVCEKHGEDVHLFCVEEQIPLCTVCRESGAHKSHTVIPQEQTASTRNQGTGSQLLRWKEDSQPTASENSNATSGSQGKGAQSNSRVQNSITWIVLIVFTIQIVGLITTVFVFTMAKPNLPSSSSIIAGACCPHGWIMNQESCFHVLDLEGTWEAGQRNCSSLGASLAVIDNLEKLNSAVSHKGSFNHWVGLLREPGESWKWLDGTTFNNHFEVEGEGQCAYLNNGVVSSTSCSIEKKWLCSQRAKQEGSHDHCKGT